MPEAAASPEKKEEKPLVGLQPSWKAYIEPIVAGVILIPFAGLGFLILIWVAYNLAAAKYMVTNKRVMAERGLFMKKNKEIPLGKIKEITTWQTTVGRMMGVGTVKIISKGGALDLDIKGVKDPAKIQRRLNKMLGLGENAETIGKPVKKAGA